MRRLNSTSSTFEHDLVCCVGQSNCAGHMPWNTYDTYPLVLQQKQGSVLQANYIQNDGLVDWQAWHQMQPQHTVGGFTPPINDVTPKGNFQLPLGSMLQRRGMSPAIACYAIGGTGSDYWAANTATWVAWFSTRAAELTRIKSVSVVIYDGETNCTSDTIFSQWRTDWETSMTAFRAAFPLFSVRCLVVRLPSTCIALAQHLAAVQALQDSFSAAQVHGGIIEDTTATFGDGVHLSTNSQMVLGNLSANKMVSLF